MDAELNGNGVETVQDDRRERQMIERFGLLSSGEGRMGADAIDEVGNKYELKSATKQGVSTGRDVGIHTLQRYRTRYWIICQGINRRTGFEFQECRFLSPTMMEGWFSSIEERLQRDLDLLGRVLRDMVGLNYSEDEMNRLEYLVRRGYTLNNPKIPWRYVQDHGILIAGDPKKALRRLMSEHPLGQEPTASA